MSWAVYEERGVEGDEKDEILSTGTVELRVGTFFVPCGEGPSTFKITHIVDTYEEGKRLVKGTE